MSLTRSRKAALATSVAAVVTFSFIASPAFAQRPERVTEARAFVRDQCLIAPQDAAAPQSDDFKQESLLGVALAGVAASFVGDLAAAGVSALADAINSASQEAGFVAEGRTSYYFNKVVTAAPGSPTGSTVQRPACLILYLPSETGDVGNLRNEPALQVLRNRASEIGEIDLFSADADTALEPIDALTRQGITTLPAVFIEAEILTRREGMVVRPVFVWYRERLPDGPTRETKAEFHATFATPGASPTGGELGTVFATARMPLPDMAPGTLLDWRALGPNTSLIIPARPTTGLVDTTASRFSSAYTLVGTRRAETAVARRAVTAAIRRRNAENTIANQEALTVTEESLLLAEQALVQAQNAATALVNIDVGATNVQARFVAIRDANKFGQTLSTIVRARATATGAGFTTSLTPPQPGSAADTAYAEAEANLAAKQRDLDVALAGTDGAVIARLLDERRVLQARLNQAAVSARRPLPYPTLLERPAETPVAQPPADQPQGEGEVP